MFAACYADFPVKLTLAADDVYPEPDCRHRWLFMLTLDWLVQYGWLTAEKHDHEQCFANVQLTEKALVALNWLPETLCHKTAEPLGKRIAKAVAQGAFAEAGRLVVETLKAGAS